MSHFGVVDEAVDITDYIDRSLLGTGRFRPQPHPRF